MYWGWLSLLSDEEPPGPFGPTTHNNSMAQCSAFCQAPPATTATPATIGSLQVDCSIIADADLDTSLHADIVEPESGTALKVEGGTTQHSGDAEQGEKGLRAPLAGSAQNEESAVTEK